MNRTAVDTRDDMLKLNLKQKDYYESRFEAWAHRSHSERAANAVTNAWSRLRNAIQHARKDMGVDERLLSLHREWLSDISGCKVLDLGCFSGNVLSLWIAEHCADYTGIDLSEQATSALAEKLRARGLSHAQAYAQDFLDNSFPDNSFDVVYAYSVAHHFKDMRVALEELRRVVKPGGMIVTMDPMQTEPLNRLARLLYRPLQTDRAWEWPFKRHTFRLIGRYFEMAEVQGLAGMARLGLPFQLVPGLGGLGRTLGQWGLAFDNRHAHRLGMAFYQCWWCTMRLRKPL